MSRRGRRRPGSAAHNRLRIDLLAGGGPLCRYPRAAVNGEYDALPPLSAKFNSERDNPEAREEATRRQHPWTTFSLPTTGGARCVSWYASRAPSSRRLRSSRRRRRTFRLVFEHPPAMCVTPFLDAV